jgi:hypothetical protein
MAYTLPPIAYGNGKPERAPPPESLSLAEARLSQVEFELRLMLVEAQTSRLEERLSFLEAALACLRTHARADDAFPGKTGPREAPMIDKLPELDLYYIELETGEWAVMGGGKPLTEQDCKAICLGYAIAREHMKQTDQLDD